MTEPIVGMVYEGMVNHKKFAVTFVKKNEKTGAASVQIKDIATGKKYEHSLEMFKRCLIKPVEGENL